MSGKVQSRCKCFNRPLRWWAGFLLAAIVVLWTSASFAKPTTSEQADRVVKQWLRRHPAPLKALLGATVRMIRPFAIQNDVDYYIVDLKPNGFVIVSADDWAEPIIAFSPSTTFDPTQDHPLSVMLRKDLPQRLMMAREAEQDGDSKKLESIRSRWRQRRAHEKWTSLTQEISSDSQSISNLSTLPDIRVSPFVQSVWDQTTEGSTYCYNYYTYFGSSTSYHYPCGCVATAMAQAMRYFTYPATPVVSTKTVTLDGWPYSKAIPIRGGDGDGGPYDWANMPLDPNSSITTTQRQAIGALTFDAGVSIGSDYSRSGTGIPVEEAYKIQAALKSTFRFSNAIGGYGSMAVLNRMMNPGLDAKLPSLLSICDDDGCHEVVADGYGYDSSATLYHHLNMGWGTTDAAQNVWYNLPDIDSYPLSYDTIDYVVYNLYTGGSGEIISGRVLHGENPVADVTITGTAAGGTYTAVSDSNGIYALTQLPSSASVSISASKTGYTFQPISVSTGTSINDSGTTGNVWGQDIEASAVETFILTYTPGSNGSISGTTPQTVNFGGSGTAVEAVPATGYHFVEWSDGSTDNPRTDANVTGDITVTAIFAIDTFTLIYAATLNGSITGTSPQTVNYGSSGTVVEAVPATGYHFVNWSDGSTTNPRIDTNVMDNITVTATFANDTYIITATAGDGGTISPTATVSHGSSATFTITPDTGYHVDDVLVDGVFVGAVTSYNFTDVTADHTISASFAIDTFTLIYTATLNGSITGTSPQTVNYGSSGTAVEAVPATGYHFVEWSDGLTTNPRIDTNVMDNITVTATFANDTYIITATAGDGGTISPTATVSHGSSATFTITPDTGYHVDDVLVDGVFVGAVTSYNFTDVTADHTISASFAIDTYNITATAGDGGTITPSVTVDHGSSKTFTIIANTGYHVADVLVDGVSVGVVTNFMFANVTADHTISTSFAINIYTITSSTGPHGTISPTTTIPYGSNATFTITPNSDYHVAGILVDGSPVDAATSYIFSNVDADHTISAAFILIGDLNNDAEVDIMDAVMAMQVLSMRIPSKTVYKEADIDGDSRIGLPDVIYLLQVVAGLR